MLILGAFALGCCQDALSPRGAWPSVCRQLCELITTFETEIQTSSVQHAQLLPCPTFPNFTSWAFQIRRVL